jgi:ribokinase
VPGEEVTIEHITRVSGGTGGNVAVAAARILGAKKVALIGALGGDDIARQQIAALDAEGVITEGIHHIAGEESGQAYILVDQTGQNFIASHLGANARLGLEQLNKAQVKQQLQECGLWDPGILISPNRETLHSLAKEAEVLFLNETEATALLGTDDFNRSLQRLRELGFRNHTVLKLGAQGAAMLEPASGLIVEVPALPLKELGLDVINTVGCGDTFVGVFAAYHVLGTNLQKSLIMASAAAGLNATQPETRGSPERASLEEVANRSQKVGFRTQEHELP